MFFNLKVMGLIRPSSDNASLSSGLEVIKLELILKLKIKRNGWLLADVSASSQSLHFILTLGLYSNFITSGPGVIKLIHGLQYTTFNTVSMEVNALRKNMF